MTYKINQFTKNNNINILILFQQKILIFSFILFTAYDLLRKFIPNFVLFKDFVIISSALISIIFLKTKKFFFIHLYIIFVIINSLIFSLIYSSPIPLLGLRVAVFPFLIFFSFLLLDSNQLKKLINISIVLYIFYSLAEIFIFKDNLRIEMFGIPRLTGFTGNPNQFGTILGLLILHLLISSEEKLKLTFIKLPIISFLFVLFIYTFSRENYIALIFSLIFSRIFFKKKSDKKFYVKFLFTIFLLIFSLIIFENFYHRFNSTFYIFNYSPSESSNYRLYAWNYSIKRFLTDRFFLFGSGFGTFGGYVSRIYDAPFVDQTLTENYLLKILGEGGLIGFILFLLAIKNLSKTYEKSFLFVFYVFMTFFAGNTFDGLNSNLIFFLLLSYYL